MNLAEEITGQNAVECDQGNEDIRRQSQRQRQRPFGMYQLPRDGQSLTTPPWLHENAQDLGFSHSLVNSYVYIYISLNILTLPIHTMWRIKGPSRFKMNNLRVKYITPMLQRFSMSSGTSQSDPEQTETEDSFSRGDTWSPSTPEPHQDMPYVNGTDYEYGFNSDPFSNMLLSVAFTLLICRFLYELRQCVRQCGSYIHRKCYEKKRLLTMKVTGDDISDLLLSDCSVCLEDFVVGDKLTILPCYHNFHSTCAKEWLKSNNSCPLCRADIYEDVD